MPEDPSLVQLMTELARLDVLIRRDVWLWQQAGQDPNDSFRGLYVSDTEASALLARPFAGSWGSNVTADPTTLSAFQAEIESTRNICAEIRQRAAKQGIALRLEHLVHTFGLDDFARDALLICLAPALDLRYERIYGYLQDDVTLKRPSVNLVLNLLSDPGAPRLSALAHFTDSAPLIAHGLLERIPDANPARTALLSHSLSVDETIVQWLLGRYSPHGDTAQVLELAEAKPTKLDELLAGKLLPATHIAAEQGALLAFIGQDLLAGVAAARLLADKLKQPLLSLDLAAAMRAGMSAGHAVARLLRDARLSGALPLVNGWEAAINDAQAAPDALQALVDHPGCAIIFSQADWQPGGMTRQRHLIRFDYPIPGFDERLALWRHFLSKQAANIPAGELEAISGQFQLTSAQIRDAVASAHDLSQQRRDQHISADDLFAAARMHSNPRLSHLARKINPRYQWDDIILPDDQLAQLREIVATVRRRPQVLDDWGLGQKLVASDGVTVLFAGPPGTGKTMAAEVIAGELGLDLYKIDLSTVVSKYIGETEKNLERIFEEAASSNAILFFDEADALFGKRSEVRDSHDRYANLEISYLLQRMEAYDGVTILATNLRANLDDAFTRRLQFAIDFPFPDEDDRQRIWQALWPKDLPTEPSIDLDMLARRFKLAGGNIRNIIVAAAYLAADDGGSVSMQHLLHGARRELQKMGRLAPESDFIASPLRKPA